MQTPAEQQQKTVDKPNGRGDANTIQSLNRGLQILDLVVQAKEPLRLADVARELGMDPASAFRLLQTLESNGLVVKDRVRKSYSVGGRLLQWATAVEGEANLVARTRPHLEQLVEASHESGHFGILTNNHALLLDYVAARSTIVVQNRIGVYEPLYCTALGKVLLAFQAPARREALLAGIQFDRRTPTTITDRDVLARALETVRHDGIAYDDGEYDPVLYCIAAPVLGCDGIAIGAIGVSMVRPLALEAPRHLRDVASRVRTAAAGLTEAIGGREIAEEVFGTSPGMPGKT